MSKSQYHVTSFGLCLHIHRNKIYVRYNYLTDLDLLEITTFHLFNYPKHKFVNISVLSIKEDSHFLSSAPATFIQGLLNDKTLRIGFILNSLMFHKPVITSLIFMVFITLIISILS